MTKATLTLLTVAAAVSMAGVANAVPFGPNNLPPGLQNSGGSPPGLTNHSGSISGNNPLIAGQNLNGPLSSVPEGGSGMIFLGAGLLALALLGRRLQHSH